MASIKRTPVKSSPSVADKSKPNVAELQESLKKMQAELDAER